MNKLITLLFFIGCFYILFYFLKTSRSEHLDGGQDSNSKKSLKTVDPNDVIDILQDASFKDTIFFTNDEDPYADGKQLGLQKCFDQCKGTCVEFGVTGNAFCFKS